MSVPAGGQSGRKPREGSKVCVRRWWEIELILVDGTRTGSGQGRAFGDGAAARYCLPLFAAAACSYCLGTAACFNACLLLACACLLLVYCTTTLVPCWLGAAGSLGCRCAAVVVQRVLWVLVVAVVVVWSPPSTLPPSAGLVGEWLSHNVPQCRSTHYLARCLPFPPYPPPMFVRPPNAGNLGRQLSRRSGGAR